jgi:serine phosphatase RsbU (regulator of sigma subunit)
VEADVTAAGALLALRTRFNAEGGQERIQFQLGPDRGWRGALKWGGYLLLTFMLLAVVFRRLSGRSLDAQAALKDALLAGGLAMVAVGLSAPIFAIEAGWGWQLAVFLAVGMLFSGAGLGLLVFMASAASDALARAVWPEKIETLSLVRQNAWVNQPVGRALLRGAASAGLVLGLVVVGMALVPQGTMDVESLFVFESSFSVLAAAFAQCVWYALLLVLAVYVGLGSSLRKRWVRAVVPGLGVAVAVVGFDGVELLTGTWWLTWGAPLVIGLVLAVLFRRYDALTLLVAVVLVGVLWDTAEGWLVAASPARVDAVLGFVLLAAAVALGVAGVRSARTGEALPHYEPDYVTEQRERGRLQRELEIAREVQRSFLPAQMPATPGLDLAARCLAAEDVGGDYYDAIPLGDGRLALVIGDVSGKGIQASFFMTLTKGFLQTLARETDSPAEVLRRANRLFFANAPRGTFISLIYGVFDPEALTFTFARAGHNPVILKRSPNQTADFVQPAGLAIGLTPGAAFDDTIEERTVALRPGDTLVLYTDGFSEAMDRRKTLYTDERIAERVAAASHTDTADALLDALVNDVLQHAGSADQHDDMTMVVVKVAQPHAADGRPVSSDAMVNS